MADVTLLGMTAKQGVQIASKSVVKANPKEKVGVFCITISITNIY